MADERNVSNGFRQVLRRELTRWQTEGLVSPDQAQSLTQRYALDGLAGESTGALVFAIYLIGALLIGCGVVSFVAWHWDAIPKAAKIVLIVGAMLACHAAGFWLWHAGRRPWLGHGLVALGTLIFGANIGLLAQIFHIHSNFYVGLGAWAVGAAALAYAAGSVPNALIAVATSFAFFVGWMGRHEHEFCYYPFVAAAAFLPLAYWKRSILTFAATLLAIGISVIAAAGTGNGFWAGTLATIGVGGLLYGWGVWSAGPSRAESGGGERFARFAAPARLLGNLALMVLAYLLSFTCMARDIPSSLSYLQTEWLWLAPVGAVWAAGLVVWILGVGPAARSPSRRPTAVCVPVAVLLLLGGLAAAVLMFHSLIGREQFGIGRYAVPDSGFVPMIVLANLAMLALAVGMVWGGVAAGSRLDFWAGILYTALLIVSRFLQYETGLWLKALAFLACGAGLIFGGVKFENYLRRGRASHA